MTANIVNQVPYLRTTREFPTDAHDLTVELDKSYLDISNAVNNRTIGIYTTGRPSINGEQWFINNQKFQSLRQIYQFSGTNPIPHGIDFTKIYFFTKIQGIGYTIASNRYFPLPFVNPTATGQIEVYLDSTNINFVVGATAPAVDKGLFILEWLSDV
jgi:hypothetical protein